MINLIYNYISTFNYLFFSLLPFPLVFLRQAQDDKGKNLISPFPLSSFDRLRMTRGRLSMTR
jgi:hypothetical protein